MATKVSKSDKTEADQIWEEIKGLKLALYSLPDQVLMKHAERMPVTEDAVHLKLKSTAVLTALEEALASLPLPDNKVYQVQQTQNYVVVRKVAKEV